MHNTYKTKIKLFLRDSFIIWTFVTIIIVNSHVLHNSISDLSSIFRYALTFNLSLAIIGACELVIKPIRKQADSNR